MAVATPTFTGFQPEAIQFLVDLAANNDRSWFQPRKTEYERLLKEPLEALCAALDEEFRARKLPLRADPGRSPFRIYRDVRFSKDKSPYKTHVAASFGWAGDEPAGGDVNEAGRSHREDVHGSGGYFHLQPGEIYVGGGVWHPETSWLTAFRQGLVSDLGKFEAVVEEPKFRKTFGTVGDDGESLKRVPPGYPADHPAGELLKLKNVTFGRRLADKDATSPRLPVVIAESFEIATPLLRYLAAVG